MKDLKRRIDIKSLEKDQKELIRKKKGRSKIQQIIKIKKHNVFTEENDEIIWSSNDDKRIHSIDSIETHAYGMRKDEVSEKRWD